MTDEELLKLAAKAVGGMNNWVYTDRITDYDSDHHGRAALHSRGHECMSWNPLIDDGDALRLAVELCMNVEVTDRNVFACSIGNFSEPSGADRAAAVRRAIVRAAAALASNGETV